MSIEISIEKDIDLLAAYGLAAACNNQVEYFLGEIIRLHGGLRRTEVNADLIDKMMDRKTLGTIISWASIVLKDKSLTQKLDQISKDRNMLSHGVMVTQGGKSAIMHAGGIHPLNSEELMKMVERSKEVLSGLFQELSPYLPKSGTTQ